MSLTKRQKRIKRNGQRIRRAGCRGLIEWPDFESEFEVQANLYGALKDAGFAVRGCVLAWCDDPDPHRVYFDLVVFDRAEGKAIAVIECKNDQCDLMELAAGTRQHRRYHKFGVPVLKCAGSQYIRQTIDRLKALSSPTVAAFLADVFVDEEPRRCAICGTQITAFEVCERCASGNNVFAQDPDRHEYPARTEL